MGNELKLSLENFQSISKGELIFHTGTNVIIGQSNSGKTATFRALKACLANPAGSQRFIKKGTTQASVMLEYNGNQIIWKKTKSENSYVINGQPFYKTGKSCALKLLKDTGFVTDWNDTIMNIEEELQLPFPFGIPKNDLFKLFEDVFCVSDSAIILKAAKGVEFKTKSEIVTLENEVNKNKNKLEALKEFKNEVDFNKLEGFKEFLEGKKSRLSFLQEGLPLIHKALKVKDLKANKKEFQNFLPEYKECRATREFISKVKELHTISKNLSQLTSPKEASIAEYENLKELQNLKNIVSILEEFDEVPIKKFENKIGEYRELKEYLRNLKTIYKSIKEKKTQLEKLKNEIKAKEGYLKEFKVCPLCHKPL